MKSWNQLCAGRKPFTLADIARGFRSWTIHTQGASSFGGAGPLHAARLAAELDIRHVLVPRNPGILCAMGLLLADLRADFAATRLMALSSSVIDEVEAIVAELRGRCAVWFVDAGIAANAQRSAYQSTALCRAKLRAFRASALGPGGADDHR